MVTDLSLGATYVGTSSDTKPVADTAGDGAPQNGSVFLEMDTSKIYLFDSDNNTWNEWG